MPIDRQTNCILELVSTLVHCWKSTATLKLMNLIKIGLPATLSHLCHTVTLEQAKLYNVQPNGATM